MRVPCVIVVGILLAGCAGRGPDDRGGTGPPGGFGPQPVAATYYLKADYRLSLDPPAKTSPDRVSSNPVANGFVNEDLKAFQSPENETQRNFTVARLIAYYMVDGPTADPFPNTSNPQEARQLVFWLGSKGVYPMAVTIPGDPVLLPNRVYKAEATFVVPAGGWLVPAGETLQLLVATLAVNHPAYDLRFLVDSRDTPSRLELEGFTADLDLPPVLFPIQREFTIPGNAGLFTGATADKVESRARTNVFIGANDSYAEIRIVFRSNQGGKSDLDFTLYAPDGRRTLSSSTPFQNETVRVFSPQISALGVGNYTADVNAYSGVNTRFSLQVFYDHPHAAP